MEVKINDKVFQLPEGTTVSEALHAAGVDATGVATALNNKVVAAVERPTTQLNDGDSILIIKAFYGG